MEDDAGRLVRGAIVLVRPRLQSKQTITTRLASFSNPLGQAHLIIPVTAQSLGKQLEFVVSARTPNAHALEIASMRLPARNSRSTVPSS